MNPNTPAPTATPPARRPANPTAVGVERFKKHLMTDEFRNQMALTLPQHLKPDFILRVMLNACLKTPKLLQADIHSLVDVALQSAEMGLPPDGRHAHIIPFEEGTQGGQQQGRIIAKLIPGYQGFIQQAYNHPSVAGIWMEVVHAKDKFVHRKGLHPTLEHEPYDGEDDAGPLTHAYAVCELKGGGRAFVVLNKRDITRIKACSRSAKGKYSPWNTHEEAMWKKSAIRALSKTMPQSAQLNLLLQRDEDEDFIDVPSTVSSGPPMMRLPEPPEPKVPSDDAPTDIPAEAPVEAPMEGEPEREEAKPEPAPEQPPAGAPTPASIDRQPLKANAPAPAPAAANSETVGKLLVLCEENGVSEEKIIAWACKTYRLPASVTSFKTMEAVAPRRLTTILNDWSKVLAGVNA